jgi:hypothetical protein
VRDAQGCVRGAGAGRLNAVAGPAHAEAEACYEAVQSAASWGISKAIIKADSSNLIHAIQSEELDLASEGVIYRDIRAFIRLNFSSIGFSFRPRNCKSCTCPSSIGSWW